MVDDLLDPVRTTQWAWVRGRALGDIDGIFSGEPEEAVMVTLQEGSPADPGPIRQAILLVCRRQAAPAPPLLLARRVAYDAGGREDRETPPPAGLWWPEPPEDPYADVRVEIVRPPVSERSLVVVTLWRPLEDGSSHMAFHRVFTLETPPGSEPGDDAGGGPPPAPGRHRLGAALTARLRQPTPSLRVFDFDRDGHPDLVALCHVLPGSAARATVFPEPEWPVVWRGGPDGGFSRLDMRRTRTGGNLARINPHFARDWYRAYAEALAGGMEPADAAWYQYYLGVLHRTEGDGAASRRRLEEALARAAPGSPVGGWARDALRLPEEPPEP